MYKIHKKDFSKYLNNKNIDQINNFIKMDYYYNWNYYLDKKNIIAKNIFYSSNTNNLLFFSHVKNNSNIKIYHEINIKNIKNSKIYFIVDFKLHKFFSLNNSIIIYYFNYETRIINIEKRINKFIIYNNIEYIIYNDKFYNKKIYINNKLVEIIYNYRHMNVECYYKFYYKKYNIYIYIIANYRDSRRYFVYKLYNLVYFNLKIHLII